MKSVGLSSSECSRETVRAVHTGMQFYMPVSVSCLPVLVFCVKWVYYLEIAFDSTRPCTYSGMTGRLSLRSNGLLQTNLPQMLFADTTCWMIAGFAGHSCMRSGRAEVLPVRFRA